MESATRRPPIEATYGVGDPVLLERLVEMTNYIEMKPDSIATGSGDDAQIRPDVLDELRTAARAKRSPRQWRLRHARRALPQRSGVPCTS